jgi:hypothetical protein
MRAETGAGAANGGTARTGVLAERTDDELVVIV